MADQINKTPEQRRIISGRMRLLCLSGLLINTIFAHLARMMALPLYLDNIGSALAAALGGYIPGIIVGFLTNLINGIWDYSSIYYGSLTILIAIASAWFAGKKYYSFHQPWRLLAVIAVFALIGGGLGGEGFHHFLQQGGGGFHFLRRFFLFIIFENGFQRSLRP